MNLLQDVNVKLDRLWHSLVNGGVVTTENEAKGLCKKGLVRINGYVYTDCHVRVNSGDMVNVGNEVFILVD